MKEHVDAAIAIIKKQKIKGCITGSCLLDYFEGQDVDVFVYDESSFNKLLSFMQYNDMFTILEPLEEHKFNDYIDDGRSSFDKIGLVSIKFKYNLLVDINIILKKNNKNLFDVISNFDLDIIATGYDIMTGKTLSLRESKGMDCTWNSWNPYFYNSDFWNIKRILRQFERVIKYTKRGYNVESVTDKYIEITENIINTQNYYSSEKGTKYFTDSIEQFEVVLKIIQTWKKDKTITDEALLTLKTLT